MGAWGLDWRVYDDEDENVVQTSEMSSVIKFSLCIAHIRQCVLGDTWNTYPNEKLPEEAGQILIYKTEETETLQV